MKTLLIVSLLTFLPVYLRVLSVRYLRTVGSPGYLGPSFYSAAALCLLLTGLTVAHAKPMCADLGGQLVFSKELSAQHKEPVYICVKDGKQISDDLYFVN